MPTASRTKTWSAGETLTAANLNTEFDGVITVLNDIDENNLDLTATYAWTGAHSHSAAVSWADNTNIVLGTTSDIALYYDESGRDSLVVSSQINDAALGVVLMADAGADAGDEWKLTVANGGVLTLANDIASAGTYVTGLSITPHATTTSWLLDFAGAVAVGGTLASTGAATLASLVCTAAATFGGGTGSSGATISTTGAGTFDGVLKTEDTTAATSTTDGSLQTDGGLSVALDAIIGNDIKLLSDSSVLSLGAGSDATLTHDGTTGVTIAANPIIVDSGGNLTLDAHTGILIIKDAGSEVLRFTEGSSGQVTVKLATDGKNLVFTDNGDATNMTILDAAAGINVPGEVQTTGIGYTDGDNAITIADGGGIAAAADVTVSSGNVIVGTAGKGIDFSAQSGPATGMTSELLDRYEEGTWAPVMTDGTNPVTMNSGTLVGTYTRVGNQVTATTGYIEATSLASASGALLITGLPFAASSDNRSYAAVTVGWAANLAITSGTAMSGELRKTESKIRLHLWDGTGGPTEFQASELSANGALVATVTYLTST